MPPSWPPTPAIGVIPTLKAWAKSKPPGNDAIVSKNSGDKIIDSGGGRTDRAQILDMMGNLGKLFVLVVIAWPVLCSLLAACTLSFLRTFYT